MKGLTLVLVDIINGADVGMIQCRCSVGLTLETLEGLWIAREFGGKEFESNRAPQLGVFSLVDDTHTAGT